jgi:hypothetical protein
MVVAKHTVEDGIHQGGVQTAAKHNHLEQEHPDRPCQDDDQELTNVFLLKFDRRERILFPFFPHSLRLAFQHDRSVRLRHHQNERPCNACNYELEPVDPPPRHHSDKTRSDWTQKRTPSCRSHEQSHSPTTSLGSGVDIGVYPPNDRNGSTSTNTSEEAHNNQARPRRS